MQRNLDPNRTITIVSGMPRSGTSMMMQMLEAAGLEIATDGERSADEDNPKGYFELDDVKRIRADASFLEATVGKVVKIVAPLLPHLPKKFDYRIIFMERELEEVLASQRTMLERNQRAAARANDEALKRAYSRQLRQVKIWLARQSNISTAFVAHRISVETPMITAASVEEFLFGAGNEGTNATWPAVENERIERMARVVDAGLHRQQHSVR